MSELTLAELKALGDPDVIETPVLKTMYEAALAAFIALQPDYVMLLASDPVVKMVQVFVYRELLLRHRINEAARASLLAYAEGADLDHVVAFYEVFRRDGETDDELRDRTIEAIRGRSTAGSVYWYRTNARAADPRVKSVAVYQEGVDPTVRLAILSTEEDGIASEELLDIVREAIDNDEVRVVSDRIVVDTATITPINITATFKAKPDAPADIAALLKAKLEAAIETEQALGWDLTRSWIIGQLQTPYVHSVVLTLPATDVTVNDNQAVAAGTITVTETGRSF